MVAQYPSLHYIDDIYAHQVMQIWNNQKKRGGPQQRTLPLGPNLWVSAPCATHQTKGLEIETAYSAAPTTPIAAQNILCLFHFE